MEKADFTLSSALPCTAQLRFAYKRSCRTGEAPGSERSVIHWLDFNATIRGMREKRKPCEALDEEATQLPSIKRSS